MLRGMLHTKPRHIKVVIAARNEAALIIAAEEIRAAGGEVSVFVGDVAKVRVHGTTGKCTRFLSEIGHSPLTFVEPFFKQF